MRKTVVTLLVLILLSTAYLSENKPILSSAELTTDTWVSKENLPTPRSRLGAAAVNGKIYAIGGFPNYDTNEEYDPVTNTWTTKAAMPTGRYCFGVAVHENKIYCIGGQFNAHTENSYAGPEYTGTIEVYNPATDTWETKKPMPNPRSQFHANIIDDKIYLAGGRTGGRNSTIPLNEVYDPETETWTTKAPMPYPVVSYASVVVDSRIYVFDGQDEFNETVNLSVTQIYDTETDTWSFGEPLPNSIWRSGACVTSGVFAPLRIYVIGGQPSHSGGATNSTQIYDPETDIWSLGAAMPTARFDLALAVVNDSIYAIGGTERYIFPTEQGNVENELYIPVGYGTPEPSPTISPVAEPTPTTEPFSTILVIVSAVAVAVVGLGLLVYFKTRRK